MSRPPQELPARNDKKTERSTPDAARERLGSPCPQPGMRPQLSPRAWVAHGGTDVATEAHGFPCCSREGNGGVPLKSFLWLSQHRPTDAATRAFSSDDSVCPQGELHENVPGGSLRDEKDRTLAAVGRKPTKYRRCWDELPLATESSEDRVPQLCGRAAAGPEGCAPCGPNGASGWKGHMGPWGRARGGASSEGWLCWVGTAPRMAVWCVRVRVSFTTGQWDLGSVHCAA